MRFHCSLNLPYLNNITKEADKVSSKLNENYSYIPICLYDERNFKIKKADTKKLEAIKNRTLR